MDALSYSLCFDTTSLAHRDAVRGERHPPHLRELHRHSGTSELLFPSARSWMKPMSENTQNAALKRLGYGSDRMTAHGFRATFSTFANESGLWHADAVERALAHVEANDVRRAYVRGEHWDERVRMAEWWGDQIDEMRARAFDVR